MNNTLYLNKSALFIAAFLLSAFCFTPKMVYGQRIKAVDAETFYKDYLHLLEDGETVIIDGRTKEMFSEGHLKNAINIDADDPNLVSLLQQYLDEPLIVVYCTTVRRTTKIVNTLREMYEGEMIYITDGIRGWQQNGFSVQEGAEHELPAGNISLPDTLPLPMNK